MRISKEESSSLYLSVEMSVTVLSCDETDKTGQDGQDKGGICLSFMRWQMQTATAWC
jgi:hypothetical protein